MKTVIAFATVLASVLTVSAARAETYTELLSRSANAILAEDWRGGLSAARRLLALPYLTTQQRASGLSHLCIHLTQVGRPRDALRACNQSISLKGDGWGVYVNRGNARSALGFHVLAGADYRKARRLSPHAHALEGMGSSGVLAAHVFSRPAYAAGVQQAEGEQMLAEP